MRISLLLAAALVAPTLSACATDTNSGRYGYNSSSDRYYAERRRDRYERYRARQLAENDVIYRDQNGNYYCKRSDGTAGTIVGAIAGGILGNIIAPGGSKTLGTILGAGGGAIAGRAIDKSDVRCQ